MANDPVFWMSDAVYGKHDPGTWHPESPQRFYAVEKMATELKDIEILPLESRKVTLNELLPIHKKAYIDIIDNAQGKTVALDPDTHTSPDSIEAAYKSAGGAIELVDAVFSGKGKTGFGNLRPPGHHAESNRAMGFCIFNNIAVAAEHAINSHNLSRVAIIDPDGHHGNGTMHTFYDRPDVLYISTHRYPFFPGTGTANEVGHGKGEGFSVNIPLDAGLGDDDYLAAFDRIVIPVLEEYKPQLLLISAGYDAHTADPLVGMNVTTQGFAAIMTRLAVVADKFADGRVIGLLEGGYNIEALASSVRATLEIFSGKRTEIKSTHPSPFADNNIKKAQIYVKKYWNI